MSSVRPAQDTNTQVQRTDDAIDRLKRDWNPLPLSRLQIDDLYLFVTPSSRVFATYQGKQNGHLKVMIDTHGNVSTVETDCLDIYKIGGDISVAEELNKRFSATVSKAK